MKYLILILLIFSACTHKAKWQDKEILDLSDNGKPFCFKGQLFYMIKIERVEGIIASVSDNNLPEKCHKIEGMK